jgi:hypothetical protein
LFVHGDEVWNDPRHRNKHWYETWFLRALTKIVSVSAFTAGTMAREFNVPLAKFGLLPNAVDPLKTLPSPSMRQPATILTVTRLGSSDREKNVGQMIRAVVKLKQILPGLTYEIAGDGPLRPELEALASDLGVGDVVKFLGFVTDAELDAAYARATVFALPSSKEGIGIVYLEAWQRGLPVICSSEGASKEIVTDAVDGFHGRWARAAAKRSRQSTSIRRSGPILIGSLTMCGRSRSGRTGPFELRLETPTALAVGGNPLPFHQPDEECCSRLKLSPELSPATAMRPRSAASCSMKLLSIFRLSGGFDSVS